MKFLRRNLKNGMGVLFERRESNVVAFSVSNGIGGAFEESEIKGIAHVIEHMLFTGTKTRTHEDISREIEKKGGVLNAFTAHEVTSYWFKLPKEHLFSGMEIICDMLTNAIFNEEKFEKEKKVILEEIKMYKDDPKRTVFENIEKAMYEKPFGELIIGSKESVSKLKRDFVYDFWKKNYNPSNYIVTIVGDIDIDKACEFLEKKFKKGEGIPVEKEINRKNSRLIEERMGIDQANFVMGMHAPLLNEDKHSVLQVLDAYLANGMSSRLFLEIREKRGLAYAVKGMIQAEKNYSQYLIYVGTTKEKVKEVEEIILEEFGKIEEMDEKSLEEAKEMLIGLRKVNSEESSEVMNELLFSELSDKAESYYEFEEKVRKVKLEEVKKLAKELIKEYSVAIVMPK